jgi:hypothetical protein
MRKATVDQFWSRPASVPRRISKQAQASCAERPEPCLTAAMLILTAYGTTRIAPRGRFVARLSMKNALDIWSSP